MFKGRKPFCEEVKCPGPSQCQLITAELTKTDLVNKPDKSQQLSGRDKTNLTEECTPDKDEILYMFYIHEEKLNSCPRVLICIGNKCVPAVLDTGSQISLLTEELYHELKSEGVEGLPTFFLGGGGFLFVPLANTTDMHAE